MNYSISVGGIFVSYFILNYVDGGTVINVSFFFLFCGWVIMHGNVFASNLEFRVLAHYKWQGFWDGNMSPQKVFDKKLFSPSVHLLFGFLAFLINIIFF